MTALDHSKFYNAVRVPLFGGDMTQSQVDGMEIILFVWEQCYIKRTPTAQLSYCLATTYHETDKKMQPITEYGNAAYFTRMYDIKGSRPTIARQLGNIHAGDGAKYPGRGDAQLTGLDNYTKATIALRNMGVISSTQSLVTQPELAKDPRIAAFILFEGMEKGWFTGASLDTLIDINVDGDEHADFIRARRIINGKDRAELIAGYADKFLVGVTAGMS